MPVFTAVAVAVAIAAAVMSLNSCNVKYSLSEGSIPPEIETVSISNFQNNSMTLVSPMLASTFTETLKDKFTRETRLTQVNEGGDLHFEGEITDYRSAPASISANEQATYNRLSITVRVRFVNNFDTSASFENRTFTQFADYPTSSPLQSVESSLIPEICTQLVDDIFNAALSNW